MFIRFSKEEDKEQLHELSILGFGNRDHCIDLENLQDRYLLAFDEEDNLIGMADLVWVEESGEYKLDWTFKHPEHHKRILYMNYSKEYVH